VSRGRGDSGGTGLPGASGTQRGPWTSGCARTAAAEDRDPVTFLALGDVGVGIASGVDGQRQLAVARVFLRARFEPREEFGRACMDPGLFHRLRVGAVLELVCVDTTWGAERGVHWFNDPRQRDWLRQAFTGEGAYGG
jgi:hypothetical protein